jgi:hypothetical protein
MIRRRSLVSLLLLLPMGVAIALLSFVLASSERSLAALERLVAATTPYRLTLEDARISWLPLRFDARQLALHYPDDDRPALVHAQGLHLEMPLHSFWSPRYDEGAFRARSLTFYLDDTGSSEPLDLESMLSPLAWLPAVVEAQALHLVSRTHRVQVLPLLSLRGERTREGSLAIRAQSYLARRRIAVDVSLDWRNTDLGSAVDLAGTLRDDASTLAIEGRVEAQDSDLTYVLDLKGAYANAAAFWEFAGLGAPAPDAELTIDGTLTGDRDSSVLQVRRLSLEAPERFDFTAHGEVTMGATPAMNIEAEGHAANLEALFPMPKMLGPVVRETALHLRLGGSPAAPVLRELALDIRHAGDGKLRLSSEDLGLESIFSTGDGEATSPRFDRLRLEGEAGNLPALLAAAGLDTSLGLNLPQHAMLRGMLSLDGERLQLSDGRLRLDGPDYELAGPVDILLHNGVLSLRTLDLALRVPGHAMAGALAGSVADVAMQRGVVVDIDLRGIEADALQQLLARPVKAPASLSGEVSLRLLKAAASAVAQAIDARITGGGGLELRLQGQGRVTPMPEADLAINLVAPQPHSAFRDLGLPLGPDRGEGQLRLRERYATLLVDLERGVSQLQLAVNAELEARKLTALRVDLYTPLARLEDFAPSDTTAAGAAATSEAQPGVRDTPEFPAWPTTFTLRAGELRGASSALDDVSIEVEAAAGDVLLRHFDARYAGGELMLRGLAHLEPPPAAFSIGGRGIRVPLGALTRDLGLQTSVSGELSFRGALTTRGQSLGEWKRGLAGQAGVAIGNTVISGAAYDLLMSNLLAWFVKGAGERTTTFDCTLLDVEINDGVAVTRSLLVDTSRMHAEGKARIDLPGDRIDLRLEPRSKDRLVQFPSAVRLRGPLSDPRVEVSGLQATADLSAQALLLLPSLPLKLLGVGSDGTPPRPCVTPAQP